MPTKYNQESRQAVAESNKASRSMMSDMEQIWRLMDKGLSATKEITRLTAKIHKAKKRKKT